MTPAHRQHQPGDDHHRHLDRHLTFMMPVTLTSPEIAVSQKDAYGSRTGDRHRTAALRRQRFSLRPVTSTF
jgi:hypothetical protein